MCWYCWDMRCYCLFSICVLCIGLIFTSFLLCDFFFVLLRRNHSMGEILGNWFLFWFILSVVKFCILYIIVLHIHAHIHILWPAQQTNTNNKNNNKMRNTLYVIFRLFCIIIPIYEFTKHLFLLLICNFC